MAGSASIEQIRSRFGEAHRADMGLMAVTGCQPGTAAIGSRCGHYEETAKPDLMKGDRYEF